MNEKAVEAINRTQAEPERALEFLKQVEEFLKKIDQATKIMKSMEESPNAH